MRAQENSPEPHKLIRFGETVKIFFFFNLVWAYVIPTAKAAWKGSK